MKKKIRIIFICLVIVLLSICCMGSRCQGRQTAPIEYGDFYYSIMTDEETGEQYIRLQGLTKQGQKQEYVVVPSEIDGIKVRELNYSAPFIAEGALVSDVLKKIYLPYGIEVYAMQAFNGCKKIEELILIQIPENVEEIRYYLIRNIYISSSLYNEEIFGTSNLFDVYDRVYQLEKIRFANVSFMYNFEGAPYSGYYWIDNVDYGTKIEYVPEDPVRDGFEFGGWYKEPECKNAWDFETDTLPEQILTNDGEEIYQETRLYAKWI